MKLRKDNVVTFDVTLPKRAYRALKKLQKIRGEGTLSQTFASVLALYLPGGPRSNPDLLDEEKGEDKCLYELSVACK